MDTILHKALCTSSSSIRMDAYAVYSNNTLPKVRRKTVRDFFEITGYILLFVLVAVLFFALVILPFHYMSVCGDIERFKSVKQSVAMARDQHSITKFERVTIQNKIISSNAWLASAQYWNSKPFFSWYYPERIKELEPIE